MKTAIVALFRDEAEYLKEWIEYHLMIGVDKFYLFNNNSSDNYLEILSNYIETGTVSLREITVETTNNNPSRANEVILVDTYVKTLNALLPTLTEDWVVHISVDEFLVPTKYKNLKKTLERYHHTVGEISVNWTMFGNNKKTLKPNQLMIEELNRSSLPTHKTSYHVKPIFKPSAVLHIPSVHFTTLKPNFTKVDASGNPNNFKNNHEVIEKVLTPLHINHYRLRDLAWTKKKIDIYKLWNRQSLSDLGDEYNDVENNNIQEFVAPLKQRMFSSLL